MNSLPAERCFYDVNLRDGHWNFPLVERLSCLASILKLNSTESETLYRIGHVGSRFSLEEFAGTWANSMVSTSYASPLDPLAYSSIAKERATDLRAIGYPSCASVSWWIAFFWAAAVQTNADARVTGSLRMC